MFYKGGAALIVLKESKQYGMLYHVCSLTDFCNYIVPNNVLQSSGNYINKSTNTDDVISFTRNKFYMIKTLKNLSNSSKIFLQLCLDGTKLSEKYKIFPYNDFQDVGGKGEAEECIKGKIKNLKSYIKEIHFDFLEYKLLNTDYQLIKEATQYFYDITYFHFNRNLKTSPYNLKTGDNITSLLTYIETPTTVNKVVIDYILNNSTREEDGDRIVYSKEQNKQNLEYLINMYNVDIKDLRYKGMPIAVLLLEKIEESKNPEVPICMLKDLIELGMPYKKEYERKAKELFSKKTQSHDVSVTFKHVLNEMDLERLRDFIKQNKQKVLPLVKNFTKTYIITDDNFDKDVFKLLCSEFPQQLVCIDVLEKGYKTKHYDVIKQILLKQGLLDKKTMKDFLIFSNKIDDFDLSKNILNLMKPDVFDDNIYSTIEDLYEKCFLYKQYDLMELILSLGFGERLRYEKPYKQFIKLANNDKRFLNLLNDVDYQ